jgi:hypothetical protein
MVSELFAKSKIDVTLFSDLVDCLRVIEKRDGITPGLANRLLEPFGCTITYDEVQIVDPLKDMLETSSALLAQIKPPQTLQSHVALMGLTAYHVDVGDMKFQEPY